MALVFSDPLEQTGGSPSGDPRGLAQQGLVAVYNQLPSRGKPGQVVCQANAGYSVLTYYVWDGAAWAPLGNSAQRMKALPLGFAGTCPIGNTDLFATFNFYVPMACIAESLALTFVGAPSVTKTVRVRRSTNNGASWSDLSVTFEASVTSGNRVGTSNPADVALAVGDLLQLKTTDANAPSGNNLLAEVILV